MTGPLGATLRTLVGVLAAVWIASFTIVAAGAPPALAQAKAKDGSKAKDGAKAKGAGALSTKELEGLVKTLEDKGKREEFLKTLKAILKARQATAGKKKEGGAGFLSGLSRRVKDATSEIVGAAGALLRADTFWHWVSAQWIDPNNRARWIEGLWKTILVVLIGLLAEFAARLVLRRPRAAVEAKDTDAWPIKLLFLGARTFLDLLPIVAFAGAAYGALPLLEPSDNVRLIALTIVYASVLSRAIKAVARMVLVPEAEGLRLIPMETETAHYLSLWLRRFVTIGVYGYFFAEAALLLGLPEAGHGVLIKLLGLVLAIMAIIFILQNRKPVGAWLAGEAAEGGLKALQNIRARLADVWHILAVLYVVAVFLVWALNIEGGFNYLARASLWTAVIVAAAFVVARLADRSVDRLFKVGAEMAKDAPGLEARANTYVPMIHKAVHIVVPLVAVLAIAQAWRIDVAGWITGPTGERFISSAITIGFVLVAALVVWELFSGAIERYLDGLSGKTKDKDRVKRLTTLLPLARSVIFVLLVIFVGLIILSELGVNIGPLLAGAGVLGLAIGFGAQTLVKDIISGLFFILEDEAKVGDVVEVAGVSGTVEELSFRTLRMRDLWGNLHTIPFSEISKIKNSSPDYAYYVFDIGVGYNEDVDHVMAVLREIDEEIRADPDFKAGILAPLDIWGLNAFDDSAVTIRARLKVRSARRYPTGREYNRRIKKTFDKLGIEIPYPHMTIYWGEAKDGTAPPLQVRHEEGLPKPKRVAKYKPVAEPKGRRKKKAETRAEFIDGED